MYDGDRLFGGGGYLVILPLEIDGLVVIDPAFATRGEVQSEQARNGCWADAPVVFEQGLVPYIRRDLVGTAFFCAALANDFHLEDLVGVLPATYLGLGEERNQSILKRTKTPLDFAFGLGCGCDEVRYP